MAAGHVRRPAGGPPRRSGRDHHASAVGHASESLRAAARRRARRSPRLGLTDHATLVQVDLRSAAEALLSAHVLALPEIGATSPTLSESMRQCRLRAGLSKTAGASAMILGNPKAWLGTAYH